MRIAIAHDYLTQPGGGERVALKLAQLFPRAPIYTSLYDPDGTFPEFRGLDVRASHLQGKVDPDDFRRSVLRYPGAFRAFDLSDYDLVVCCSAAFSHHVRHPAAYVYCNTPPRFLYDPATYVGDRLAPLLAAALSPLRIQDRRAARACAGYVGNSRNVSERIWRRYGIVAPVIHPPLITDHLPSVLTPLPAEPRALLVCRLLPYKRADLAVEAAVLAGVPLTVVGDGPERERLERLGAGGDVTFLGRVDDDTLRALWSEHSVALMPGVEDFGYAPVESNYCGRPVVAREGGGALETVVPGITGERVPSDDPKEWASVLTDVIARPWDPQALRATTAKYEAAAFDQQVLAWLGLVPADL